MKTRLVKLATDSCMFHPLRISIIFLLYQTVHSKVFGVIAILDVYTNWKFLLAFTMILTNGTARVSGWFSNFQGERLELLCRW